MKFIHVYIRVCCTYMCTYMRTYMCTYIGLVRKSQRMKLCAKSIHELEDNAKINFKECRCESHD